MFERWPELTACLIVNRKAVLRNGSICLREAGFLNMLDFVHSTVASKIIIGSSSTREVISLPLFSVPILVGLRTIRMLRDQSASDSLED